MKVIRFNEYVLNESRINEASAGGYTVKELAKEFVDEYSFNQDDAMAAAKSLIAVGGSLKNITGDLGGFEFGGKTKKGTNVEIRYETEDDNSITVEYGDDAKTFDYDGSAKGTANTTKEVISFLNSLNESRINRRLKSRSINESKVGGYSVNEAKKYSAKDVSNAWDNAFDEDISNTDRADVIDDIKSDYSGKVTIEELEEIYDDRYGDELEDEFVEALTESHINEAEGFSYTVKELSKELQDEYSFSKENADEHAKGLLTLGKEMAKDGDTEGDLSTFEFFGSVNDYPVDVDVEADEDGGTVNVRIGEDEDTKSFDFTSAKGKALKAYQAAAKYVAKETK